MTWRVCTAGANPFAWTASISSPAFMLLNSKVPDASVVLECSPSEFIRTSRTCAPSTGMPFESWTAPVTEKPAFIVMTELFASGASGRMVALVSAWSAWVTSKETCSRSLGTRLHDQRPQASVTVGVSGPNWMFSGSDMSFPGPSNSTFAPAMGCPASSTTTPPMVTPRSSLIVYSAGMARPKPQLVTFGTWPSAVTNRLRARKGACGMSTPSLPFASVTAFTTFPRPSSSK